MASQNGAGVSLKGFGVFPSLRIMLVPLLPNTERIQPDGVVDDQHPIKVFDLMLEEFSEGSFSLDLLSLPGEILVLELDTVRSLDAHEEVRNREAVIPHVDVSLPDVDYRRIDQEQRFIELDVDDPDRGPNLGGGKPAAIAVA